jgi:hypothetical protein
MDADTQAALAEIKKKLEAMPSSRIHDYRMI